MMIGNDSSIVIITGFYGSGKSEFSLNYALERKKGIEERIYIVDLDIINPYFRTRDKMSFLMENDIEILGNVLKEAPMADIPQVSANMYLPIHQNKVGIYDLGGTENGLKVIAGLKNTLLEKDYDLFLVINVFRDETDTVDKIIEYIKKTELISGLKVTGLINNSNLLELTTIDDFKYGDQLISQISSNLSIPIKYGLLTDALKTSSTKTYEYPIIYTSRLLRPWE